MGKKRLTLSVKGSKKSWGFDFYGDPADLSSWRADGLVVDEVESLVPEFIVELRLHKIWWFVQDIWNLSNPWRDDH